MLESDRIAVSSNSIRVSSLGGYPSAFLKSCFIICFLLIITSAGVAQIPPAIYRINAGGAAYTDSVGQLWSADQYFNTGNTYAVTSPITGTADPKLFQSQRYDPVVAPEMQYSFPVS